MITKLNPELHAESHLNKISVDGRHLICDCGHSCNMGTDAQRKLVVLNLLPFRCWHCERLLFQTFTLPVMELQP